MGLTYWQQLSILIAKALVAWFDITIIAVANRQHNGNSKNTTKGISGLRSTILFIK